MAFNELVFFKVYFKAINIRGFSHGLAMVRGDYSTPNQARVKSGEIINYRKLTKQNFDA